MKRLRIVVSLPNDNAYQHEQGVVAKLAGERLGLDLQVIHAEDDSITQSQQLLRSLCRPSRSSSPTTCEPRFSPPFRAEELACR